MAFPPNQNGDTELFDLKSGASANDGELRDWGIILLTPQSHIDA